MNFFIAKHGELLIDGKFGLIDHYLAFYCKITGGGAHITQELCTALMVGQEKANRKREFIRTQQRGRNNEDENDATMRCIDVDMKEDGYSKALLLSKQDQTHIQYNCFIKNICVMA